VAAQRAGNGQLYARWHGGLSFFVTHFFSQHTIVTSWSPILAFTISVAVGVLFGTYPARRAAYLDPIEALRHD
jgi:putative ABC transport system permease protein